VDRVDIDDERLGEPHDIWSRGAIWVLAQLPLTALALFAARRGPTLPHVAAGQARWIGAGRFLSGAALFVAGALAMGSRLTPFPRPNPETRLMQTGPFGLVRHPIYGGGVIAVPGWDLFVAGELAEGCWRPPGSASSSTPRPDWRSAGWPRSSPNTAATADGCGA
jgi:protein-S-isoprenylcysteine O-methyltransferase Ste14